MRIRYDSMRLLMEEMVLCEHPPIKRKIALPNEAPSRSQERREKYAASRSNFTRGKKYFAIQGLVSQNNISIEVQQRKLKITGSQGRGCLCCSVAFHLTLEARPQKAIDQFSANYIDQITMRGLNIVFQAKNCPGGATLLSRAT